MKPFVLLAFSLFYSIFFKFGRFDDRNGTISPFGVCFPSFRAFFALFGFQSPKTAEMRIKQGKSNKITLGLVTGIGLHLAQNDYKTGEKRQKDQWFQFHARTTPTPPQEDAWHGFVWGDNKSGGGLSTPIDAIAIAIVIQKNLRAHKIRIGTSINPFEKAQKTPPPLKEGILWAWGFSSRKNPKVPGAHRIGAAISSPRIAGRNIMDMSFFCVWLPLRFSDARKTTLSFLS